MTVAIGFWTAVGVAGLVGFVNGLVLGVLLATWARMPEEPPAPRASYDLDDPDQRRRWDDETRTRW